MTKKAVGLTASVGYQIGVSRTLLVTPERAWAYLVSAEGRRLWMGTLPELRLEAGAAYESKEGVSGELRVVKPCSQLRLTWKPEGWTKASTLQIRLTGKAGGKTTISFHQEHLRDGLVREDMRRRWEAALDSLRAAFDTSERACASGGDPAMLSAPEEAQFEN